MAQTLFGGLIHEHYGQRLAHLPDGPVLSLIGGVKVRIIEASVTVTCHDGTSYGGICRLATTLLDHRAYPAHTLIALYHERQHEVAYLALRHASAEFLHHDGLMDDIQADRAEAQLRAGVYARLSETYDAAESVPTQLERGTDHAARRGAAGRSRPPSKMTGSPGSRKSPGTDSGS